MQRFATRFLLILACMQLSAQYRYLRLNVTAAINDSKVELYDVVWVQGTNRYDATPWWQATTPANLDLDLEAGNAAMPDKIILRTCWTLNMAPRTFNLYGSNDQSTWTLLDSRTNLSTAHYTGTDAETEFIISSGGPQPNTNPWTAVGNYVYTTQAQQSVGIGTSSPTEKFEVAGTAKASKIQSTGELWGQDLYSTRYAILHGVDVGAWLNVPNGNVGIGTNSPESRLHVVGTTYLNGNVGIGTASPEQKLHVEGNGIVNGNLLVTGNLINTNAHFFENITVGGNLVSPNGKSVNVDLLADFSTQYATNNANSTSIGLNVTYGFVTRCGGFDTPPYCRNVYEPTFATRNTLNQNINNIIIGGISSGMSTTTIGTSISFENIEGKSIAVYNNTTSLGLHRTILLGDVAGIGTSTPGAHLHVKGDGIISSNLTVAGYLYAGNGAMINLTALSGMIQQYKNTTYFTTVIGNNQFEAISSDTSIFVGTIPITVTFLGPNLQPTSVTTNQDVYRTFTNIQATASTQNNIVTGRDTEILGSVRGLSPTSNVISSETTLEPGFKIYVQRSGGMLPDGTFNVQPVVSYPLVPKTTFTTVLGFQKTRVLGDELGIGTTAPGAALHVTRDAIIEKTLSVGGLSFSNGLSTISGNLNLLGYLKIGRSSLYLGSNTPGSVGTGNFIYSDNGPLILNENGERVAIGTTNPLQNLHIKGSNVGDNADIMLTSGAPNSPNWNIGAGETFLRFATYNAIENTFSDKMEISQNGNVGIGINDPTNLLHLNATNVNAILKIGFNANAGVLLGLDYGNNTLVTGASAGDAVIRSMVTGKLHIASSEGTIRTSFVENGNVGIGINIPAARLHVVGAGGQNVDILTTGRIKSTDGTDGGMWFGDTKFVGAAGANSVGIYTEGNWRVLVGNNGKVGIGVTDAAELLHVGGNLRVDGTISANGLTDAAGNSFVSSQWTSRTSGIYYNSGTVAIGTTTEVPTGYQLAVNGAIICKKIRVDNTLTPDYVFENEYKLMDIKELEKYIAANKHLPNIPSAKQMQTEGMDVTEAFNASLRKIEELTLYIIEQNKRLEQLESRLR